MRYIDGGKKLAQFKGDNVDDWGHSWRFQLHYKYLLLYGTGIVQ